MKTLLIANRGEIACRIAKTAHALGYTTVAVYSDADQNSGHVNHTDIAVALGGHTAAESYLDIDKILAAAANSGADAIHPGYGFLAENAEFAQRCVDAGLTFVGPPPEAIRLMGSKRQAKLRMQEANVPCVPGYSGADQSVETLTAQAKAIGAPLMIKASAGGGGRGLRLLSDFGQLSASLAAAKAEAEAAFKDGELILERAVQNPRHVEIQVFADQHGHVIHLGERDCSVQRRHQKVIEEAPGPSMTPELRTQMGEAAVAAARAIGYVGAGTVEFLLDGTQFYFMEMNTRLQVEHPVTEMITGLDLVAWQLDVAEGRPLEFAQEDLRLNGHAIEVRLYAEDPAQDFLPQTGQVGRVDLPKGPGIRVDHGLIEGQDITTFYDAMLAKLIAHGRDRAEALRKLVRALETTVLHGVHTNQAFLLDLLSHETFAAGAATTGFIQESFDGWPAPLPSPEIDAVAAALWAQRHGQDFWRNTGPATVFVRWSSLQPKTVTAQLEPNRCTVDNTTVQWTAHEGRVQFSVKGIRRFGTYDWDRDTLHLTVFGRTFTFTLASAYGTREDATDDVVRAPMAGRIVELRAAVGDEVKRGDIMVILEAMKMQLELTAPRDGPVAEISIKPGDQVDSKAVLVRWEKSS